MILSLVTYSLCIFGTFLTRYGLVTSVHAFPEPGLGILFLVLLVAIWAIAALLLWRKHCRGQVAEPQTGSLTGRRFIRLTNWLMVLLAFGIFVGTLFPFFSGLFTDKKIELGSVYFTKITTPLGLVLLLLLSVCPHLLRQGISKHWRTFSAVIFGIIAVAGWVLLKSPAIACFILCGFAVINLTADLFSLDSATQREKQSVVSRRGLRWYGARIAHIGVVMIFLGIAGSGAYDIEKQAALRPGQSMSIGKFNIRFEGFEADHGPTFTAVTANVTVYKRTEQYDADASTAHKAVTKDGRPKDPNKPVYARLKPSRAFYGNGQKTSEVDIKRTLLGDLYVGVTGVDARTELVNLRVLVKPLVNWIWIGSAGLVLGAGLVLISFYRRKRAV
jgi:cytochrome c-type biogenesis protein CcmF